MVPGTGLEPVRGIFPQRILSPQRLPFRHPGGQYSCYRAWPSLPSRRVRSAPKAASPETR